MSIKNQDKTINIIPKNTILQKDFIFQLESTWYQFNNLIKIISKFSDFIYAKLSETQFSFFLKSPLYTGIRISFSIPLKSFDTFKFNLEKEHYLCISLDDLKHVIERFKKKRVNFFNFAYFKKYQKIALKVLNGLIRLLMNYYILFCLI